MALAMVASSETAGKDR